MKGQIDKITLTEVKGWVCTNSKDKPRMVSLYINDLFISSSKANVYRPDLEKKKLHETGYCGFIFKLDKNIFSDRSRNFSVKVLIGPEKKEYPKFTREFNPERYIEKLLSSSRNRVKLGNKVLVTGLNKSGTSALTYSIARSLGTKDIFFEPNGNQGWDSLDFHFRITAKDNLVTKVLFQPVDNFDIIAKFYNKKIWIIRDPRDWLISVFFYKWYSEHNKPEELFEQALNLVKKKENAPFSIHFKDLLDLVLQLEKIPLVFDPVIDKLNYLDSSWLCIKYEDFIKGKVSELICYLGFRIDPKIELPNKVKRVERTKGSENWRNWFTEKDCEFFKHIINPILDKLGYDSSDWKLNPEPELDPKMGSKYMEKIHYRKQ